LLTDRAARPDVRFTPMQECRFMALWPESVLEKQTQFLTPDFVKKQSQF
jgi:hypothetical protein